ncbi:type I-B CRISPR-associated protein Cas8b1/Cst1 [Inconstantimicrobium porci]|uniref:Type I-B CRISPR-associated protein Cas8b1/Cst1 n=1 Tax=Inconstantimicrobium porci TaxID=2652291 RepID=A0A7X2MZE5_9CLOT|nr:type I-B CRISPR-associated protein Cas8b1/Cst1 [Inconstantimicrobium porci]MSR91902.1 type I-B CRISPR-associated protein Cas8b1/Cst1 [Inconstantimicrobium porci]
MKIYNSDNWFYKLGIVGFNRIMKYNQTYNNLDLDKFNYYINEDYIQFDVELLNEFASCFYKYFINQYDTAKLTGSHLDWNMSRAQDKSKFTDSFKDIKKIISDKNKKIAKLKVTGYNRCEEIANQVKKIKYDDLDKLNHLLDEYKVIISEDKINIPITINYFKSVLSNSFFGQVSFLNVCNNSKSIKEQEQIIFNDYVQPVIDSENLKNIISLEDEEELKKFTVDKCDEISSKSSDVEKVIKVINKDIFGKKRKAKSVNEILERYNKCQICEEEISYGSDYSDGNFIPLAISDENSQNMFWNFNAKYPICPVCRLVLLCTAAGAATVFKNYMDEKYSYNDKLYYGFISMDGSLKNLIDQNEAFRNQSSKDISFEQYVLDYIGQKKEISLWQLQNILYVEFNADYGSKNSKLNYFNIPVYLAKFIVAHSDELQSIKDTKLRKEIFDALLKNQNLQNIVDLKLRSCVKTESFTDLYVLRIIKIENYLKQYKQLCEGGIKEVDDSAKKNLDFIYWQGSKIATVYRDNNGENKLPGICYRLLNATKAGNKKELMDTVIRIYMSAQKEIPYLFLDIIKESKLDYEEIAHSFIAGLNSKERESKEEK